jgi:glycyl-tRNA synthetase beta chain
MSSHADLLVELGTEELPPTALKPLALAFKQAMTDGLQKARLKFDASTIEWFATPRRLALIVPALGEQQPDQQIEKLGPALKAAYDKEGKPSKAAEGFARSNSTSVDQLVTVNTDKGERLAFQSFEQGVATKDLLQDIINDALSSLPIPKRMRWGASRAEFVRPVHWLLVLMGDKPVNCEVLGVRSAQCSYGHRFHAPQAFEVKSAQSYAASLEQQGNVIASFDLRKQMIVEQVEKLAVNLGGQAVIDDDLLDEVTALVEKPVALAGAFDAAFLAVPHEALIYSMSEHQKYFHVVDAKGNLLPHFITVSNISSKDPQKIVAGNERVIRPRLADAAFFFEQDKKLSLATLRERLKPVVFQQKLGTVFDKTQRIADLASHIAKTLDADQQAAKSAGQLCKADLASDMVLEFDKMQGVAGGYYATNEGLPESVADAIRSHYLPRYAGDAVPEGKVACAVALADRLDTLTGIFGIGQQPSGSKDPFALRRAAIGILQIILQNQLSLNLAELVEHAVAQHGVIKDPSATSCAVTRYIFDRFAALYQERSYPAEVFQAVNALDKFDALDFDARAQAVAAFINQPESASLAAANKRVANILEKSDGPLTQVALDINTSLLSENAETALFDQLSACETKCQPLFKDGDYEAGLLALTTLKNAVDDFFDAVMVNVDDAALKANRLTLLRRLRQQFMEVADISLLAAKH